MEQYDIAELMVKLQEAEIAMSRANRYIGVVRNQLTKYLQDKINQSTE